MTNRSSFTITWESTPAMSDAEVRSLLCDALDVLMESLSEIPDLDPAVTATLDAPDVMADGVG